ncbi:MAG: hypothetical protein H7A49_14605 [Akkermansiaceae bacterium]|nr:hypothetical protein [Akkermansiaceae bacterium]MCP5545124.1 hypothetical protein [Akkermansiaceae bacterium]MCP5546655.1 hypothetical protein [Akkermansiaceae bacterium]
MNPIRRLARLLLFLTLATLARAVDLPRVAVVTDSPEPSVAAFADFLFVSLASASNQYTLVERAELTRLASEAAIQKLAADQRPAVLAKLAKADGLIIVGTDEGDPKLPKLTLRLTSTNNGLVLRSLILGGKQDEYPKAAEFAAGVMRFPCECLTHGDAKPPVIVSLLGIRPAFEIDRALKGLLFAGAGMGYTNGIHFIQGIPRSGGAASALLYITWNDINMWLARNKPAEIAPTIR